MSSRSDKETRLKHNVITNAERATRCDCQKMKIGRQSPQARKLYDQYLREFQQSARRVEKTKLHEVWNN